MYILSTLSSLEYHCCPSYFFSTGTPFSQIQFPFHSPGWYFPYHISFVLRICKTHLERSLLEFVTPFYFKENCFAKNNVYFALEGDIYQIMFLLNSEILILLSFLNATEIYNRQMSFETFWYKSMLSANYIWFNTCLPLQSQNGHSRIW